MIPNPQLEFSLSQKTYKLKAKLLSAKYGIQQDRIDSKQLLVFTTEEQLEHLLFMISLEQKLFKMSTTGLNKSEKTLILIS